MKRLYLILTVLVGVWLCSPATAAGLADDCKKISSAGMKYIANNQNLDGSYGDPANVPELVNTTALVVYAMAAGERKYRYDSGPFISDAVDFLLKNQKADGTFGNPAVTANVVSALKAAKFSGAKDAILAGEAALKAATVPEADFLGIVLNGGALSPQVELPAATEQAPVAEATIKQILAAQELKSKAPKEYGKVKGGSGCAADPVVSTALAVILADTIAANKSLK